MRTSTTSLKRKFGSACCFSATFALIALKKPPEEGDELDAALRMSERAEQLIVPGTLTGAESLRAAVAAEMERVDPIASDDL